MKCLRILDRKTIAVRQLLREMFKKISRLEVRHYLCVYSYSIIFAGIILISMLWIYIYQQVAYDYSRAIHETSLETMNLTIAFEEHLHRIMIDADNDLLRLKQVVEAKGIDSPDVTYIEKQGDGTARNQIAVYNKQGFLIRSFIKNLPPANYSNREYFKFHQSNSTNDLYIGPLIQLKSSGEKTIPMSRRISEADGSFGGIVYIGLKVNYFAKLYQKMNLGENHFVTLVRTDGTIIAQQLCDNFDFADINNLLLKNALKSPTGTFLYTSSDGIERMVSYCVMPDYHLIFVIGKSTKASLVGFEKRKWGYFSGASLITFLILISCYLLVCRLEQQRKINTELSRLDRLNTIGEMAASIGHEVRNPLTTVRGYLQLFQRKAEFLAYHKQLETMIDELDRANAIITEFLSLAKNKAIEPKKGNLNDTICALYSLLWAEAFHLGQNIQIDVSDIPPIIYDDKEIRQLILNLARNGMEAMNTKGVLTVKTYLEKGKVVLIIQDTGTGIPEEILKQIGMPFKTTKDKGTGLGLSICYRIADRHHAKIEVESSGNGTTFFVYFPVPPAP